MSTRTTKKKPTKRAAGTKGKPTRKRQSRASIEDPSRPLSSITARDLRGLGGGSTRDAEPVTAETALSLATFFQGVDMISGDCAKLPCDTYRYVPGGRETDTSHPAYRILKREPNEKMSPFSYLQTTFSHGLVNGNGYSYIERDSDARPKELWPLNPARTAPCRVDGKLWYLTMVAGQRRKLHPWEVLHLHGLGDDGTRGYPVIELAAASLGLTLAVEDFGREFFEDGSMATGAVQHPGELGDTGLQNLRRSIENMHSGAGKRFRFLLLEEGAKFEQMSIPNEQAQFLQTRDFQRREIAAWLKCPPSRLGDVSSRTWASLEQDTQNYLDSAIEHWLVRFEQECWKKLLTEEEKRQDSHYFEFNRNAIMRIDAAARSQYYQHGLMSGWLNRDEVRAKENMNPIPNGEGKKYYVPLNMALADESQADKKKRLRRYKRQQKRLTDNAAALAAHRQMIAEAARRILSRVASQARAAAQGPGKRADSKKYCIWLETIPQLRTWATGELAPPIEAIRALTQKDQPDGARMLMDELEKDLRALADNCNPEDLYARVNETMTDREANGPEWLAEKFIRRTTGYALAAA